MSDTLWTEIAARAATTLTDAQRAQLHRYLDALLSANERMNLTRIESREAAEIGHVGDALTLLPFLPPHPHKLADVGSGGGVPGIPLAIARPDTSVTLIEATQKKANFLRQVTADLGLSNVKVVAQRAEEAGLSDLRESFDVVVARAVGALAFLAEWCLPLVRKGGKFLAMKGQRITDELPQATKAIQLLGGGATTVHPVALPGAEHHVIVETVKVGRTDRRYPRLPTIAKGKPLF